MAQRRQRGWLKKELRTQGETWVLYFRTTRKFDGRRVENKIPIGFVLDFPDKSSAWAEVERLHLALNPVDSRRGVTFADLAQHYAEHELVDLLQIRALKLYGLPPPKGNPVSYALGGHCRSKKRNRPDEERKLVENLAVGSGGRTAATRGPGLFGFGAGDRRIDGVSGRCFHPADGTTGDAVVPGGRCSVATAAVPGRGLVRHRLLAVSLLSQCTRQRRSADQGCAVCARRPHHAAHRARKVFLHIGNARQRNSAGTRRAFRPSWCGHCLRIGTGPRSAQRAGEEAHPGGSGGGHCSRI